MKKQLKVLGIFLTFVFSIFSFSNQMLFQTANATYVEGAITQDTVWTLANSPFVLSNNVTVYPGVTLTIEPGVEVWFGGEFSLIVNGRLIANGLENKVIHFASSSPTPNEGNWGTILFDGTMSSSLSYCVVEYGTNGITVENGILSLQNSFVRFSSESGIVIIGGSVTVKYCEITNNARSGIYIAGGSQVLVQNNLVSLNTDGIFLTGHLTGAINISQNNIMLNGQSGIVLEADAYDNTVIVNNNVTENLNGFLVLTDTKTYITQNYILDNSVGIYYESGNAHEAHFNNICSNDLGMDVSSTAHVDATYNYWGHRSGPFHEFLNPRGKGNPVGGDGLNLDFIFFLSDSIDYDNQRPTANVWTDMILVAPNQNVTFVAADSTDEGRVDQYFFDFGDESNSGWTTLSLVNHSYATTGIYIASVTVIDDFNVTSENVAVTVVNVTNLTPLDVSISLSSDIVNATEQVLVTAYVSNGTAAQENANVTLFAVNDGSFDPISGLTDSTGHFTSAFTAPNVTDITNVRIIARASQSGYADGSDYEYVTVLPPLAVHVSVDPPTVKSEEAASVTVYVTESFEKPVADVSLLLSCDQGVLFPSSGITDVNGRATFSFTAPQTSSQTSVTVTVLAMKTGYAEGHGQGIIVIEPKVLAVQIAAEPNATISEGRVNVTVHVSYEAVNIQEANVTLTSEDFATTTSVLSDAEGNAIFILTAPPVNAQLNATIGVRASKTGYADGENQLNIIISPGILTVYITTDSSTIASTESTAVTIHVTCDADPVANASIIVSSTHGNLSQTAGFTDSYGYCTLVFTAPRVVDQPLEIELTANATKNGFVSGADQIAIVVTPETGGGGWPLTTILLILIPIVIVVIFVVLIKLKIIELSAKEEEE